jgi:hypothetical protein
MWNALSEQEISDGIHSIAMDERNGVDYVPQ